MPFAGYYFQILIFIILPFKIFFSFKPCFSLENLLYLLFMAIKVKPVQATVIRDKKIVRQVIAEVRSRPSAKRLAKLEKEAEFVMSMVR
jgi:hypothetical protein